MPTNIQQQRLQIPIQDPSVQKDDAQEDGDDDDHPDVAHGLSGRPVVRRAGLGAEHSGQYGAVHPQLCEDAVQHGAVHL